MGIQGLLPMLKEIQTPRHVKDYKGKTIGVDAYVWLHRGVYSCSQEVATGQKTLKYVSYAMGKIRMLRHFGVEPYVVFDGGLLPSKMGTEDDRGQKRADALARGKALLAEGKAAQAREHFVKACDVTPEMAYQLIKELKRENVQYVVAPYEADSQLCFLEREGIIDGLITEDSDLLVFGCKTILFKMDAEGNVIEIKRDRIPTCRDYRFDGWSEKEFRHMAILSGCDYLDSICGLGLKTAHSMLRKHKTAKKVIQAVRLAAKLTVPRNYEREFERANLTFLHQCVFDPRSQELVHLTTPPATGLATADFIAVGGGLDRKIAAGIACGAIDPLSRKPMVDIFPNSQAVIIKAVSPRSNSQKKSKFDVPEKGTRDIRNFFGQANSKPKAIPKRKALSNVGINSPPKKKRALDYKEMVDKMPTMASKFFGGPAVAKDAEVQTVLDDSDDEGESGANTSQESIDATVADQICNVGTEEDEEAEEAWRAAHEAEATQALAEDAGNESLELAEPPQIRPVDQEPEDIPMDADLLDYATSELCASEFGDAAHAETEDEAHHFVVSSPPQIDVKMEIEAPLKREESKAESLENIVSSPAALKAKEGLRVKSPSPVPRLPSDPFQHREPSSSEISEFSEPLTPAVEADQPSVHIQNDSGGSETGQTPLAAKTKKTKKGLSKQSSIVLSDDDDGSKPVSGDAVSAVVAGWHSKFARSASSSASKTNIRKAVAETGVARKLKGRASDPLPRASTPLQEHKPKRANAMPNDLAVSRSISRMLPAFTLPQDTPSRESTPFSKTVITDKRLASFICKSR